MIYLLLTHLSILKNKEQEEYWKLVVSKKDKLSKMTMRIHLKVQENVLETLLLNNKVKFMKKLIKMSWFWKITKTKMMIQMIWKVKWKETSSWKSWKRMKDNVEISISNIEIISIMWFCYYFDIYKLYNFYW